MAVYGTTGLLHTSTVATPPSSLPEQGPRGAFYASETTFQVPRLVQVTSGGFSWWL